MYSVTRQTPSPHVDSARLYWQGILLLVALFAFCKVLAHTMIGWAGSSFGFTDVVALAGLAALVGGLIRYRLLTLQRAQDEAERQRALAATREAENAAALRVARAVAREFAQPLSGALGYSELLMLRVEDVPHSERQELEGMREGVLQMERMLHTLRQTIETTPACPVERRIADDVERCVAEPRPRLQVRGAVAAVQGLATDAD